MSEAWRSSWRALPAQKRGLKPPVKGASSATPACAVKTSRKPTRFRSPSSARRSCDRRHLYPCRSTSRLSVPSVSGTNRRESRFSSRGRFSLRPSRLPAEHKGPRIEPRRGSPYSSARSSPWRRGAGRTSADSADSSLADACVQAAALTRHRIVKQRRFIRSALDMRPPQPLLRIVNDT